MSRTLGDRRDTSVSVTGGAGGVSGFEAGPGGLERLAGTANGGGSQWPTSLRKGADPLVVAALRE